MAGLARLTRRSHPSDFAEKLRDDPDGIQLDARERALVDYAAKLTRAPADMRESDLDAMRAAGLSDRDILDTNLIVGYFAYVNRIADGLGVRLEEE